MVDWHGLLDWSSKYSDGTKKTTEFKPMSKEDMDWLLKAIESQGANAEAIRMKEIGVYLKRDDLGENEENGKINALDELLDLVEGPRNSQDLHIVGGLVPVINTMLHCQYESVRMKAAEVFCSVTQNNTQVQVWATENGGLDLVDAVRKEKNLKSKESAISALSCLLKAENVPGKKQFLERGGAQLLLEILNDEGSTKRMIKKIMALVYDILSYEGSLPEAKELRIAVEHTDIKKQIEGFLLDTEAYNMDLREASLMVLLVLSSHYSDFLGKEWKDNVLKPHMQKILVQEDKELYERERYLLNALLSDEPSKYLQKKKQEKCEEKKEEAKVFSLM